MTKRPDFSEDEFEYDHLFIDALEEYADALEERIEELETELAAVRKDRHRSAVAMQKRIEELEARVEFLESDGPLLEGFLE